tara:strand:- start:1008 stop:2171 length:1164 start_codon:yes stop_codon:yes gene_type:complete
MTLHLPIGGSTAARTLACPAWLKKSENVPKRPAGEAAMMGSMHHAVQEKCQRENTAPNEHTGFIYEEAKHRYIFNSGLRDDDLDLSNRAYNATNALMDELDIDDIEIESFVQLVEGLAGGTLDLLGLSLDRKHMLALDYKFGQTPVDATENAQLLFCLVAARMDPATTDLFKEAESFTLAIIQPKLAAVPLRWTCRVKELDEFEARIGEAIKKATGKKERPGTPGKHCDWCPAAPYCTEKRTSIASALKLDPKSHNALNVSAGLVEEVEAWVKTVKEEMFLQMTKGVVIDGWKIVEKQPRRKWLDENRAEIALRGTRLRVKDIIQKKLITAPAALKLLKQRKIEIDLNRFIEKVSTGTTIAPENDKRDAVVVTDVVGHLAKIMGEEK